MDTRQSDAVLWETRDRVAQITLNRPDRLNAWTPELGRMYHDYLDRAAMDPEVRAIIITGAGRGFCPGADMEVLGSITADAHPRQDRRAHSVVRSIPKPVIAAINGPCAGMGLVVAMMCDVRFAASEAKFTTAFARRGLIAEYGLAWVLPRAVGLSRALDLLLSGRTLLAPEAHELGIVDRVVPGELLLESAHEYARELAEYSSPWSMAMMKRQVYQGLETDLATAEQLADALMVESFGHPDLAEGVASYQERRRPEFAPLAREQR
jgi:enoyl-CoA hydratase/carnithine racemase